MKPLESYNMKRKIFNWLFKSELEDLKRKIELNRGEIDSTMHKIKIHESKLENLLSNIGVGVDVHEYDHKYSPSWAVVCIQGKQTDFIKFVNLGERDLREISKFLHHFERNDTINIDATPQTSKLIRMERKFL